MKVAVIGAGISGLSCALALDKSHAVTVYEKGGHAGGHTYTVDATQAGRAYAVDLGFIVHNRRNYPLFSQLLAAHGVPTQASEMSFSLRCERTGLEYNGHSLNTMFAQRRNLLRPSFHRMLRDILEFNRQAKRLLEDPAGEPSVSEFVAGLGLSAMFSSHYLIPMAAAIWSSDPAVMADYPARMLCRFFANHGLLDLQGRPQWRVIAGGSRSYVAALLEGLSGELRTNTTIRRVIRGPQHVTLIDSNGRPADFDAVVFACHSDQALELLADPTAEERATLGAIRYRHNHAVLHTDAGVLPRRPRAWAAWNYHLPRDAAAEPTLTYNMNILQSLDAPRPFCVTLNPSMRIDPAKVLHEVSFEHPVYSRGAVAAQANLAVLNGVRRTFFCGAYWGYGFHEDGVRSGLDAARNLENWQTDAQLHIRRTG